MTMKLMPFNFRELDSGEVLISNLGGFFHLLPNRETLSSLIDDPGGINEQLKKSLLNKLFMAKGDRLDGATKLLASSYAFRQRLAISNQHLFMIVPTLRCDHNCTYCQVSRVSEHKSGYDLPDSAIPPTINFIRKVGKPPYKIEFQGGEPLLRFDFIRDFVDQFECSGDPFQIVIATSLSRLGDEIIDWARDKPVFFSTSLDGPKLIHNKHRRHAIINSYSHVVSGIRRIQDHLGKDRVATVTTVTRDALAYPEEIVDAHLDLELSEIFVRPISPFGFASYAKAEPYGVEEYVVFYKRLLLKVIAENRARPLVESNALVHLERIFKKNNSGYVDLQSPAGYILSALVINYDGNIFGSDEARMIYQSDRVEEFVLGNVMDESLSLASHPGAYVPLEQSFTVDSPGCEECAYQPYCGADVMFHAGTHGEFMGDKSLSRFCEMQQRMFDLIFTLYHHDAEAREVFRSWLNG